MHCSVVYPVHMSKDFDGWNRKKKTIEDKPINHFVREGDVWWCSIGINIGSEQDGKNEEFQRPVLVIRKFNEKIFLAIPFTSKPKDNGLYFNFIRNNQPYSILLSQVRLLSTKRLRDFMWRYGRAPV